MTSKISPLWKFESLGVLVNTLTAYDKCLVQDCENYQSPIQMKLFLKHKPFSLYFFHLWNLHQILNIFENKMIVMAKVFPKLQTVKTWVNLSIKSAVSEHPLTVNMLKSPKHLGNLRKFLSYFLIIVRRNNLENISLIESFSLSCLF